MFSNVLALTALAAISVSAAPAPLSKRWVYEKYFDLQGHRGGRGEAIENTIFSFGWGIIDGVTTLEMDNGLTKDGEVVVWHDESIDSTKCLDTAPVTPNDPMFPYVGKYIANLTLAQIKTLDCGSERLAGFPNQLTNPGTKIATLQEMFDFVKCATDEPILFNIESKVDPDFKNLTRKPEDFANAQLAIFKAQGPDVVDRITYQSFDWRTLILSKKMLPELRTAALCDDTTIYKNPTPTTTGNLTVHGQGPSNWLAGIDIDSFNGSSVAERVAQAAASIDADVLSSVATAYASPATALDQTFPGYIPFTNATMVDAAHALGLKVKPWTPDRLNIIKYLLDIGVDGVITDFPEATRRYLVQRGYPVAPVGDYNRVTGCINKYLQKAPSNVTI